jgi:hypothetical protein
MKRPSRLVLLLAGGLIGAAIIAVAIIGRILWPTKLNQNDCFDVAGAFAESLLHNNTKTAKSLTTSQQWNRLDDWTAKHTVFHCPRRIWWDPFDENESFGGGGGQPNGTVTATATYGYRCYDQGYYLLIDDIILQPGEDGCKVIEWKTCEIPKSKWFESGAFECR